jgi:hypothetical protein
VDGGKRSVDETILRLQGAAMKQRAKKNVSPTVAKESGT